MVDVVVVDVVDVVDVVGGGGGGGVCAQTVAVGDAEAPAIDPKDMCVDGTVR